ncbi:MAG: hypothetical protein NTV22_13015 [bacterium]|nr:hypothetical protein [bacterium]
MQNKNMLIAASPWLFYSLLISFAADAELPLRFQPIWRSAFPGQSARRGIITKSK